MQGISKKAVKPVESVRQALGMSGLRVTNQRALILDIIRQGKGHLDADEVHRQAKRKQPRLSLSTVYRTLQRLKKLGLVDELHFDEEHHHYEMKPRAEHQHLVCLGCGRLVEFQYPLASLVKRKVPAVKDFEIIHTELRMTGYCPECLEKRK